MLCGATTAAGSECKNRRAPGTNTCRMHDGSQRSDGRLYVLANKRVEGVKIGWTSGRAEERARALSSTALPTPFTVEHESDVVAHARRCEQVVFERLAQSRVAANREFFDVSVEEAQRAITAAIAAAPAAPPPAPTVFTVPDGVSEVTLVLANLTTITVKTAGAVAGGGAASN